MRRHVVFEILRSLEAVYVESISMLCNEKDLMPREI